MPSAPRDLVEKAVNTIRMLAADGVQQANSGHPGMPMGAADMAFVLWTRHLRFDPQEPRWLGRDRFILSGGHGSMLLYSLLHLAGFDCTLDDLKRFRQIHSRTPGHPEFGLLPGVECTTGPLGQGVANAVGFALGQAMLAARLGPGSPIEDHFVYTFCGDGDMMEGVCAEAASFAGHQKLGRLICLYDDNGITIDGKTSITFTEDVTRRFEAYGWQVQAVDGRDHEGIDQAIAAAKADLSRPSLIRVKTVIGFGAPKKAGTPGVHGAALGEEELAATRKALGWPESPRFLVPDDVRAFWGEVLKEKAALKQAWSERTLAWRRANPEKARLLDAHVERAVPADLLQRLLAELPANDSTRKVGHALVQKIAPLVPSLEAGSADLFESNNNDVKGGGAVAPGAYGGRNIFFGVREHAMGAIANGLAYDGLFIPAVATFFQFLDYMRPPVRLAALSKLQTLFVYSHDSVFLGEDGPTHQPVEHLTALRAIPGIEVWRPADPAETAVAWSAALARKNGPSALILTRQKLAPVRRDGALDPQALLRGGYAVAAPAGATFAVLATGSEVPLAQAALEALAQKGKVGRLVSVPCLERFLAQPAAWRDQVLPPGLKVAAVEAARGIEWWRLIGRDGLLLGIDRFGESAPEKALAELFGFTPAKVAERLERWLDGQR
ncbi:MAG TPA: transketolase [Anaeromyxobacter sp.]|nr:transketolase [Anaeromyxobacter sp.]